MTAFGVRVLTLAFPDPDLAPIYTSDFQPLDASISYTFKEANKIRTLSTTSANSGHDIDGLLFTPTLPNGTCPEAARVAPQNATTAAQLPSDADVFWVAIAPWINKDCTLAYLEAARSSQTQAFLFWLNDNGTDIPPIASSPAWSLGEGGRWKSENHYPVYAVPASTGRTLMQHMADYSGNVTEVPNGHALVNQLDPRSYVRLAMEIDVGGVSRLPSLWVFLLIVLGILIFIISLTSCSMHLVQRRRRESLRRRVAAGEVDLEALGIKRLTVPQAVVEKITTYTYFDESDPARTEKDLDVNSTSNLTSSTHAHTQFAQATCAICLDDYVSGTSTVRELPCGHIFHPDCIDLFLRQNSSLCPMCKKTVLPRGYCPAVISNAMVRRERMVRRIRERVAAGDEDSEPAYQYVPLSIPRVRHAVRTVVSTGRRVFSAPTRTTPATPTPPPNVQMRSTTNPLTAIELARHDGAQGQGDRCVISPNPDPPAAQGRREWARERAVAMLGSRRANEDHEIEAEAARRPTWRRAVAKVFPGFA